jgi:hypothetical protein
MSGRRSNARGRGVVVYLLGNLPQRQAALRLGDHLPDCQPSILHDELPLGAWCPTMGTSWQRVCGPPALAPIASRHSCRQPGRQFQRLLTWSAARILAVRTYPEALV